MSVENPLQIWSSDVSTFPSEPSSPTQMYEELPEHGQKKRKLVNLPPTPPSPVEEESLSAGTSVSGDDVKSELGDCDEEGSSAIEKDQSRENARSIRDWMKEAWTEKTELVCLQISLEERKKTNKDLKIINEPYNYLISHPGKDIRKQVIAACNVWLQVDRESLDIIGESVSMLHNASLL